MLIEMDTKIWRTRVLVPSATQVLYLKGTINSVRCLRNLVVGIPSSLSGSNAAQRDGPHNEAINKLKQFTINQPRI